MTEFIDGEAIDCSLPESSEAFCSSGGETSGDTVVEDEDDDDEDLNYLYRGVSGTKRKRNSQILESDSENEVISKSRQRNERSNVKLRKKSSCDVVQGKSGSLNLINGDNYSVDVTKGLMDEVKRSNKILLSLVKRAKKTENRLRHVEDQLKNTSDNVSSPGSTPRRLRQKVVPEEVRRETRRVYNLLLDEDSQNFTGWRIGPGVTYRDSDNQVILDRLVREVKALNPIFLNLHIKDAAYRFYRSKCEDLSSKRRGKHEGKIQMKRRYQRKLTKLNERKAMLAKGSLKDDRRGLEQWKAILTINTMSSDESDEDEGEEVLIVHPIPWLSHTVSQFKISLDQQIALAKTPQAKRQMKKRVIGCPSARNHVDSLPSWALKD